MLLIAMAVATRQKTIPELCTELGFSPAWLRKFVHYLGLKWIGQRGKRVYFDSSQVEFFHKIVCLRRLGFDLEDIKWLYDTEREIVMLVEHRFPVTKSVGLSAVRSQPIYLTSCLPSQSVTSLGVVYDGKRFDSDKEGAKLFKKLQHDHGELMKYVSLKFDYNYATLTDERKRVQEVTRFYTK